MRTLVTSSLTLALTGAMACSLTTKLGLPAKKAQPERVADRDGDRPERSDGPERPADLPEGDPSTDGDVLRDVFVASPPEHGHKKVEAMSPPWCADVEKRSSDSEGNANSLGRTLGDYGNQTIRTVGSRLCVHPNDPVYQEQTAHFVQGFMNLSGLEEADAITSLTLRMNEERWKKRQAETCARYPHNDEDIGPSAAETTAMRDLFGCGHGGSPGSPRWARSGAPSGETFAAHYDAASRRRAS